MDTTMPFGRYRGLPLSAAPASYLWWLATRPNLRPPLRGAVLAEIGRRAGVAHAPSTPTGEAGSPRHELVEAIVGAGLRALARKHHPDVGGDTATMQAINAAAAWLRRNTGSSR
jgi:hypothetical protein